jgi:SAM-dependent methyltransferase
MDIEKDPEQQFLDVYDIVISTNCIHATKDLVLSTTNIRKMLRPDGILCLVELTRNLFWFDLVFGLLEGWWLFNDGREHVLASEDRWERCLNAAGYNWVDWSDSPSKESDVLRVITASPTKIASTKTIATVNQTMQETVVFKEVNGLELNADIYYPSETVSPGKKLPVGETRAHIQVFGRID